MDASHHHNAMLRFAEALQAIRLYPHRHPVVRQSLDSCLSQLLQRLDNTSSVRLTCVEGGLYVNDAPLPESNPAVINLRTHFEDLHLQGLEFHHGLTANELYDTLDLLGSGRCIGETLEEAMAVRGVYHIRPLQSGPPSDPSVLSSKIYRRALAVVERVCQDVRLGRIPSSPETVAVVRDMVQQTLSTPHSLFALSMLKDYDNYTFQHSVNVAVLSLTVGQACGVSDEELNLLALGGLLHDLGKLTVPIDIINKPGQLSDTEYEEIMLHPGNGAAIAQQMESVPSAVLDIIRGHHLRYDRTGYPLDAQAVPLNPLTDMVAIADCFDAMTTLRVYQRPMTVREALKAMRNAAGQKLNPEYLQRFIDYIGPYPVGSLVRLKTGEIGLVVKVSAGDAREVVVKLLFDRDGKRFEKPVRRLLQGDITHEVVAEVDPFVTGVNIPDHLD